MLWYKSWLETRWRFLIGLVLLAVSAAGGVLVYPQVMKLMPAADSVDIGGEIGRRIRESMELARNFRGYMWSDWIRGELTQIGTLFAVLLGTGGLLSQRSGTLFTLSLPVSRGRLLASRAATGLAELFLIMFTSSLMLPLLSPAIGERFGFVDAVVHAACAFVVASIFLMLSLLLSTVFDDVWRPMLITLGIAIALGIVELLPDVSRYGLFRVMSAETWFRTGALPAWGLLISAALSGALYYGAAKNLARRDF